MGSCGRARATYGDPGIGCVGPEHCSRSERSEHLERSERSQLAGTMFGAFCRKNMCSEKHIVFPWNNMTPKSRNINPLGIYFLGFVDLHNLV